MVEGGAGQYRRQCRCSGVRNGKGGNSFVGKMSGGDRVGKCESLAWGENHEVVGVGLGRV